MNTHDRTALDRLREDTMAAENGGDAAYFDGVAAKDIVVIPPNAPVVLAGLRP